MARPDRKTWFVALAGAVLLAAFALVVVRERIGPGDRADTGGGTWDEPSASVRELWRYRTRYLDVWSTGQVLATADAVYALSYQPIVPSNPDDPGLVAIDAATGQLRWTIAAVAERENGNSRIYPLLATDEALYIFDRREQSPSPSSGLPKIGISAIDPATGSIRWNFPAAIAGSYPEVAFDPDRARMYSECWSDAGEAVCAVDSTTGREAWRWPASGDAEREAAGLHVAGLAVSGVVVVAAFTDGRMVGLEARSGRVIWQRIVTGQGAPSRIDSLAAMGDLVGVVTTGAEAEPGTADRLIVLDSASGEVRWSHEPEPGTPSCLDWPLVMTGEPVPGLLLAADLSGTLVALDAATGRRRWEVNPLRAPNTVCPMPVPAAMGYRRPQALYEPVIVGATVVFAPLGRARILHDRRVTDLLPEHALYGVDLESGALRWRFDLPGELVAPPVLQDGRVVVATSGPAALLAIDAASGREAWRAGPLAEQVSAPVVLGDRVIVSTLTLRRGITDRYEDVAIVTFETPQGGDASPAPVR